MMGMVVQPLQPMTVAPGAVWSDVQSLPQQGLSSVHVKDCRVQSAIYNRMFSFLSFFFGMETSSFWIFLLRRLDVRRMGEAGFHAPTGGPHVKNYDFIVLHNWTVWIESAVHHDKRSGAE